MKFPQLTVTIASLSAAAHLSAVETAQSAESAQSLLSTAVNLQLESGAWREEILGDLNGAIRIYQHVLEKPDLGERVRAETTHRLGVCFLFKGHSTHAVTLFLRVIREYPHAEPFANRAAENLLLISPDARPSDRTWYQDEASYLGDLALSLDGALEHTEKESALEIIKEMQESFGLLLSQFDTATDRQLREQQTKNLELITDLIQSGHWAPAKLKWDSNADLSALKSRTNQFETDDVNAWTTARRDAVALALNHKDADLALAETSRLLTFVTVVTELGANSLTRDYTRLLQETFTSVNRFARARQFSEARSFLRQANRVLDRTYGAYTLHVPGLNDFPESLLPELVASLSWIELAQNNLDDPGGEPSPVDSILKAIQQVETLRQRVRKGPASVRLDQWKSDFQAAATALKSEKIERGRKWLQPYSL